MTNNKFHQKCFWVTTVNSRCNCLDFENLTSPCLYLPNNVVDVSCAGLRISFENWMSCRVFCPTACTMKTILVALSSNQGLQRSSRLDPGLSLWATLCFMIAQICKIRTELRAHVWSLYFINTFFLKKKLLNNICAVWTSVIVDINKFVRTNHSRVRYMVKGIQRT